MFFSYSQNNSGGSFVHDGTTGISQLVIVEAESSDEANSLAEGIGLYFDGDGDCPCCGDRWYLADGRGDRVPSVYDTPVAEFYAKKDAYYINWMGENPDAYVHYKSGVIEAYKMGKPSWLVVSK